MSGRAVIGAGEYACRLLKARVDVTCVERREEVGKKMFTFVLIFNRGFYEKDVRLCVNRLYCFLSDCACMADSWPVY